MANDLINGAVEALRAGLGPERVATSGPVHAAGAAVWNGAVSRVPSVVVRAEGVEDVRAVVLAAREHGVPLAVRGGGHDWNGRALADGGITLDLSGMRGVEVDADARVARVGGGATAADLVAAAEARGLVAVTGTAGGVGVVGLSLGGGYGPLSGRFGLAVDNVLSVEVVLADGAVVTASADREPELFWAVRGGGGNFGVVTAMAVRLHRAEVRTGMVLYPWAAAEDVLAALDAVVLGAPDALTVQTGVITGPHGGPLVFAAPTWCGDEAAGDAAVAELVALAEPVMRQFGPSPLSALLANTDAMFPPGRHVEIRTRTLPGLTAGVRAALRAGGEAMTSPLSGISLHSLRGAAARPTDDTAFGDRTPHLMAEIIAIWEPGEGAAHREWAAEVATALTPHARPGGYPNLLDDDPTRVAAAYGPNAARLTAAKRHYDPDGAFTAIPLPTD